MKSSYPYKTQELLKSATSQSRGSLKSRPAGRYRTGAITRSATATTTKTYPLASEDLIR
jgi:hypothetical protein